jgi:hypothetical protein
MVLNFELTVVELTIVNFISNLGYNSSNHGLEMHGK